MLDSIAVQASFEFSIAAPGQAEIGPRNKPQNRQIRHFSTPPPLGGALRALRGERAAYEIEKLVVVKLF